MGKHHEFLRQGAVAVLAALDPRLDIKAKYGDVQLIGFTLQGIEICRKITVFYGDRQVARFTAAGARLEAQ